MPSWYRAHGADAPFGDPRRYHGAGMEGHFWRFTQPERGLVVIVILAISRDADGRPWSMASVASHPSGAVVSATAEDPVSWSGDCLSVRIEGARLDVSIDDRVPWPRRAFGAMGPAQIVPGLSQYWHPWLLGGRVRGTLRMGGQELSLDGATAYAEKNWGAGGMPPTWWWGQADAFGDDVCVAFAGGSAGFGPLRVPAGAVVARVGSRLRTCVRPPRPLRIDVGATGWRLRGGGIEVEGEADGARPLMLPVPVPRERRRIDGRAPQLLAGRVRVRVSRRGRLVYAGESPLAGLELGRGVQRGD